MSDIPDPVEKGNETLEDIGPTWLHVVIPIAIALLILGLAAR
jgi:hypothetical protein